MIIIKKRKFFNFIIILGVIIVIVFGFFFYSKLKKVNPSVNPKEREISVLISKVSKLYLFPGDEVPTIATVSDPLLLKDQAFFTKAEVGDNVLIFLKAGEAVLYRPSVNKIIEIAPVKK